MNREKIENQQPHTAIPVTITMYIKRGAIVEFVGSVNSVPDHSWRDKQVRFYNDKYGLKIGDQGKVVRAKGGWVWVTWTLQDGSKATSVPMRSDHFTVKPNAPQEGDQGIWFDHEKGKLVGTEHCEPGGEHILFKDGEDSPVRPTSLLYGFDAVASNVDASVEVQFPTKEHIACARLLKVSREQNERLEETIAAWRWQGRLCPVCGETEITAYDDELIKQINHQDDEIKKLNAELDKVKLRLIASRTLMQLKDKTIAELRGAPSFERWGDWVVPAVGSG